MKRLFVFILIFISINTQSQVFVEMGTGWSTKNNPVLQLGLKTYISDYFVQLGYISHISSRIENGTLFNITSGIDFYFTETIKVSPTIGYSYHLKNVASRDSDEHGILVAQQVTKKLDKNTSIFLNVAFAESRGYFILGMTSNLSSEKRKIEKIQTLKF